jgi:hypothetical protein
MILALGLASVGFMGFKFYKARLGANYHTLWYERRKRWRCIAVARQLVYSLPCCPPSQRRPDAAPPDCVADCTESGRLIDDLVLWCDLTPYQTSLLLHLPPSLLTEKQKGNGWVSPTLHLFRTWTRHGRKSFDNVYVLLQLWLVSIFPPFLFLLFFSFFLLIGIIAFAFQYQSLSDISQSEYMLNLLNSCGTNCTT